MSWCRSCKQLLSVYTCNKVAPCKARTIICTSIKASQWPKVPDDFKKHIKSLAETASDSKDSRNENEEKKIIVTLGSIFSDENKTRVQNKMKLVVVPRPDIPGNNERRAAVLVPLCYVNGEPSLLFMMRSIHLKQHRGEISFPGGMQDPTDKSLTHTALRETYEEIGLPMDQVEVWGEMQPSPSKITGSWVTPVVGMCGELDLANLHLNHSEVEEVFTVTVSSICDPAKQRQTQWRYPGTVGYTLPVYLGGKYRIWGLSALMLHQCMTVLAPGLYKFKLRHRT